MHTIRAVLAIVMVLGTSMLIGAVRPNGRSCPASAVHDETNHTIGTASQRKDKSHALGMVLADEVQQKSSSKVVGTKYGSATKGKCCCKPSLCAGGEGVEHTLGSKVYCCKNLVLFFCDTFSGEFELPGDKLLENTKYKPVLPGGVASNPCTTAPAYSRCTVSNEAAVCQPFLPDGPQFNDITQGELGDCYFLAAFIAIAEKRTGPGIIKEMFIDPNCQSGDAPVYRTRWYPDGVETIVAVDAQVPYYQEERVPWFASPKEGHKIVWPMIVEKAWAKIFGSYEVIDAGNSPAEVMKAITGAPTKSLYHKIQQVDKDDLWEKMMKDWNSFPIAACSGDKTGSGIADQHCFAVRDVMISNGKTVHLQQPWGVHKYKGNQMQYQGMHADPGSFFMTWDEYFNDMDITAVAFVRQDYVPSSLVFPGVGTKMEVSLNFNIAVDKPFSVTFDWTRQMFFDNRDPGCLGRRGAACHVQFKHKGKELTYQQSPFVDEDSSRRWTFEKRDDLNSGTFTGAWEVKGTLTFVDGFMNYQVAAVVYAAERVNIQGTGTLLSVNRTTRCNPRINHLLDLDNVEDIKKGRDSKFPPEQTSIGSGNMGDLARGIESSAETYNNWKRFTEFCQ